MRYFASQVCSHRHAHGFPLAIFSIPVTGVLKGFDQLLNLVLDDVEEQVVQGLSYLISSSCDMGIALLCRIRRSQSFVGVDRSPGSNNNSPQSCRWAGRNIQSFHLAGVRVVTRLMKVISCPLFYARIHLLRSQQLSVTSSTRCSTFVMHS